MKDVMAERGVEDRGQSDRFAEAWEEAEAHEAGPVEGAQELLKKLSGDYVLGVATNGTGTLQRRKIAEIADEDVFQSVLVSSEIGVSKPNARFFEHARESVGAERFVMVSQELRRDILPAKREDFLTVWVSKEEGNPQVEQLVDRRVETLEQAGSAVKELCVG